MAPVWMMLPLKVSPSTICGAEPAVVKKMGRQVQTNQTGRPSDLSQHANLIETLLDERTRPVQALWHRRFWALPSGRSTFEFRWTAAVQRSELASAPVVVRSVGSKPTFTRTRNDASFHDRTVAQSRLRPVPAAASTVAPVAVLARP